MTAHPVWFKDNAGKWSQINGVTDIVVATPLVGRGTYRNSPPVTPAAGGGAIVAVADGSTIPTVAMQIAGGVTPTVTPVIGSPLVAAYVTVSSPSSIENDDDYNGEVLHYVFGPEPMIFFKTSVTGSPSSPDASTFPTDRPDVPTKDDLTSGGHFPVITGDCFFPWTKNCGVTNTPPQGWVVFTGA